MLEAIIELYEKTKWDMVPGPSENILSTTFSGSTQAWTFVVFIDPEDHLIVLFSRLPFTCSPTIQDEVGRFIEQANFGISQGAWVMDREDGEIRFKVGSDLGGAPPTRANLEQLTMYTNFTMEAYLPAFKAVMEGQLSAEEALSGLV